MDCAKQMKAGRFVRRVPPTPKGNQSKLGALDKSGPPDPKPPNNYKYENTYKFQSHSRRVLAFSEGII